MWRGDVMCGGGDVMCGGVMCGGVMLCVEG